MSTPEHYNLPIQPVEVIEAWELNFNLGNVIKYLARAGKKGSMEEDLEKALWYLRREVENQKVAGLEFKFSKMQVAKK